MYLKLYSSEKENRVMLTCNGNENCKNKTKQQQQQQHQYV